MEDVVAFWVKGKGREVGFLTWGRVFDRVDEAPLIEALRSGIAVFGFPAESEISICDSLQEVSGCRYFYEGLLIFSHKPIPFGKKTYWVWAKKMRKAIPKGKEICLLGDREK